MSSRAAVLKEDPTDGKNKLVAVFIFWRHSVGLYWKLLFAERRISFSANSYTSYLCDLASTHASWLLLAGNLTYEMISLSLELLAK